MGNGFARVESVVDHQPEAAFRHPQLPRDPAGGGEHAAKQRRILRLRLCDPRNRVARNDQHVDWGLGIGVMKRDKLVRFINDPSRDLPGGDFFKNSPASENEMA
jgi:hypothetical protein